MNKQSKPLGVLGYWAGYNYGSELTNYATYKFLKDNGYKVQMFDIAIAPIHTIYRKPPYFLVDPYEKGCLHGRFKNKTDLKRINDICNTFISTSDQQLSNGVYEITGKTAALDFITSNKKKIAYAASFGFDKFYGPEFNRATISHFLKEIDFFSVREQSGVKLAKDAFGVNATFVLDPVFLIDNNEYETLIQKSKIPDENKPYLFSYILDFNENNSKFILDLSSKLSLDFVSVTDAHKDYFNIPPKCKNNINLKRHVMIEDWLKYIKNCDFYITDSFHGTCLGIILKKQFIVLGNNRGRTRLESILSLLGLNDRFANNIEEAMAIINKGQLIDYSKIENILNNKIAESKEWLLNAIESDIGAKAFSTYDILESRIEELKGITNILLNKNKIYYTYYRYKWLAKLLVGKKRQHYIEKAKIFHNKVRQIRKLEKEAELC